MRQGRLQVVLLVNAGVVTERCRRAAVVLHRASKSKRSQEGVVRKSVGVSRRQAPVAVDRKRRPQCAKGNQHGSREAAAAPSATTTSDAPVRSEVDFRRPREEADGRRDCRVVRGSRQRWHRRKRRKALHVSTCRTGRCSGSYLNRAGLNKLKVRMPVGHKLGLHREQRAWLCVCVCRGGRTGGVGWRERA